MDDDPSMTPSGMANDEVESSFSRICVEAIMSVELGSAFVLL